MSKFHRGLAVVGVALASLVLAASVRVPFDKIQVQVRVRGHRLAEPVWVTVTHKATRCIWPLSCRFSILGQTDDMVRHVDARRVSPAGEELTIDSVPLHVASVGADRLEGITIRAGDRGLHFAGVEEPPTAPTDDEDDPYRGVIDTAPREGDAAVLRTHVHFLPSTIYFDTRGLRTVRLELDVRPLPVSWFTFGSRGWQDGAHAASGSAMRGSGVDIRAGAHVPLPYVTGLAPQDWPAAQGRLTPLSPDAATQFVLVDWATLRDVLGLKAMHRRHVPMSRADWDALRRRADVGGEVVVEPAALPGALIATTRPNVTARRYVLIATFRPGDALASAEALELDVHP